MAVRIVRLGAERTAGEGLRIGTVRRPPRGVPKNEFASRNFYDVWLPNLAPSEALLKAARAAADERAVRSFFRRYRAEMRQPDSSRVLDLLAALSRSADFSANGVRHDFVPTGNCAGHQDQAGMTRLSAHRTTKAEHREASVSPNRTKP